jgi:hypothetical protein
VTARRRSSGKAASEFAEGKPLELLSGSYLCICWSKTQGESEIDEVPGEWKDPILDTAEV